MATQSDQTATPIAEGSTAKLTFTVQDEDGNGIAAASLTTLTLTLYDKRTAAVINSRDGTDILNAGPGTVDSSGNAVVTLAPADNPIVGARDVEEHIALIEWTFNSGAKGGKHEIRLRVHNLANVP